MILVRIYRNIDGDALTQSATSSNSTMPNSSSKKNGFAAHRLKLIRRATPRSESGQGA